GRSPPELVQTYRGAYERRLRRLGIAESALTGDTHLPEVQIDTNVPVTTNAASLSLRVRASDTQYPLDRLNVFLNDVPVFGTAGIAVADRTRSLAQDIQVPLVSGRNKIQVSVLNQQGTESLKQTVYTASTATFAPPDVYVVVFAAGHGMTDAKQNYYFGTYDIDPEHPEENGLPYEDFEGLLDGIAALQKVLLIDTCFSGEIDKDEATVVAQANTGGAGTVKMRAFKAARGVTVVGDDAAQSTGGATPS